MIEPVALTGRRSDGTVRPTRYIFTLEHSLEHVRENTYKWVNPVSGAHEGYAVAEHVDYAPTLTAQFLISRGVK